MPAKRIYLAGPMTGLPEYNYPAFHAEAARLRGLGFHVENPAEHGHIEGAAWSDYLRWDISRIAKRTPSRPILPRPAPPKGMASRR